MTTYKYWILVYLIKLIHVLVYCVTIFTDNCTNFEPSKLFLVVKLPIEIITLSENSNMAAMTSTGSSMYSVQFKLQNKR